MLRASLVIFGSAVIFGTAVGTPAIEAVGVNINAAVAGGEFQVNGAAVAVATDVTDLDTRITAAVEAVRSGLSNRVDRLERQLAGNVTSSTAAIDVVSAALNTYTLTQAETLAGIEADIAVAVGWVGGYNAGNCTTEQCSIVVYGRGFVALPGTPPAGTAGLFLYTVTVAIDEEGSSTTMPCTIDEVAPTWIRCTITDFQGPPSRAFWLSASVSENGQPFPFFGSATPPVRVAQMQALGPTVSFGGTEFLAYSAQGGTAYTHRQAIAIADPDHPTSGLTVTFTSSNTGVLPTGGMSYLSSTGQISFAFLQEGSTDVSVVVTDELGLSASISVTVTLVETVFTCDNPAVFRPGGQSCFQDPIDRAWGRGVPNCSPLFDGAVVWNPGQARHVNMNGEFTMEFNAMTVYTVTVAQKSQHRQGYFELWAKDLDSTSSTYGQLVRFFESGSVNANGYSSPVGPDDASLPLHDQVSTTIADVPAELRRTDAIKFVSVVPSDVDISNTFVWVYRMLEMQLVGCS